MRGTALVADDDIDLLETVAVALEGFGLSVVRAGNGAEMIEAISEHPEIDVVVADVAMPWMTGPQAVLSARRAGLSMPVVLITALEGGELARQLTALGPVEATVVHKPFSLTELLHAVRAALRSRGRS
jgi:CheY-like chemotaxis protein